MANIQITDLYISECFMLSDRNEHASTLAVLDTERIVGGRGMSVDTAFQVGLGMVGSGIGVVAMGLGPVGMLAGGFLYGGGMVLSMYSGYLIGGGRVGGPMVK